MRKITINTEGLKTVVDAKESAPRGRRTRKKTDEAKWSIVSALEFVLNTVHDSELKDETWEKMEPALAFLRTVTDLTNKQLIVLAMLIDAGQPLSYRNFAAYCGCSRLRIMTYQEDIDGLVEKRWAMKTVKRGEGKALKLAKGVTDALSKNKTFVPQKIDGLSEKQFYATVSKHFDNITSVMNEADIEYEMDMILDICNHNPQIEMVRMANELPLSDQDKSLFYMIVCDYIEWNNTPDEGLLRNTIEEKFEDEFITVMLDSGEHTLMERGYIEFSCEDGIADNERYKLTREAKNRLFAGKSSLLRGRTRRGRNDDIKEAKNIKEKTLFYNHEEGRQIERLTSLLSKENLKGVQSRLEEKGMRKGFACLFYGPAGTGKTETALQLAKMTGRDIMIVDIASIKDKWVGESEKNIKMVFTRYRELCNQKRDNLPILLFNEADALICKRSTHADSAVDKMNNAMQNILLQEMEDLEGILIATTNLTENMDSAFDRRFLFKIEFRKPEIEVKTKIWSSMIDEITEEEAHTLASRYDFSGGQIENVARKKTIDYIINGETPTLAQLDTYCQDELLAQKKERKPIVGFGR